MAVCLIRESFLSRFPAIQGSPAPPGTRREEVAGHEDSISLASADRALRFVRVGRQPYYHGDHVVAKRTGWLSLLAVAGGHGRSTALQVVNHHRGTSGRLNAQPSRSDQRNFIDARDRKFHG